MVGLTVKASTSPCVHFTEGIKKKRRNKKKRDGDESNHSKGPTRDEEPGIGGLLCQENGLDAGPAYCDVMCIHVK